MNSEEQDQEASPLGIGLNNYLAKETYSVTENKEQESDEQPAQPSPAEKPKFQLWPTIKRTSPLAGKNPVEVVRPHLLMSSQSSPSLRDSMLVTGKRLKQLKEVTGSRRRKISIPDLGFGPMTTVQEHYVDSPTIPGRFPLHERSNSAPSWGRSPFENSILEPVAEPAVLTSEKDKQASDSSSKDPVRQTETEERAQQRTPPGSKHSNHANEDMQRDMPPAVPPKSPRMVRTPPSAQAPTSKFSPPSPNGQTAAQIPLPLSRGATPVPTSPNHITNQLQRTQSRRRAASASERQRSPKSQKPSISVDTTHHHKRNESSGLTGLMGTITELSHVARNEYMRDLSQTPIMERGRPPTKNGFVERKTSKRRPSVDQGSPTTSNLPLGVVPQDAFKMLSVREVERLHEQARGQAQKFEILKYNDVKALSQELRVLDERCEYLRNTHNSLRAGRRSLHERMISYLRSPTLTKYSRESMLKQEEALASLDQAIDEWVAKLEYAENRQTRVRQKLLEHMAAALLVQRASPEPTKLEESPPPSPDELATQLGMNRKDIHSIKIYADERVYADAKVYALFEDIEKEMELMTGARNTNAARSDTP